MRSTVTSALAGALILFAGVTAPAQSGSAADIPKCPGPIYSRSEVTKPAKMIGTPDFKALYDAFGYDLSGRVRLDAVFCRTGRVTDMKVIESHPEKIAEMVAAAVSLINFKPAEKNWHTVSQKIQLEFSLNENGLSEIDQAKAAGRLIEEIDVMGNRRFTKDQILSWIKSRPGETYNADQIQKDFNAVLSTGYFDKQGTRVYNEEAPRGGLRVIFEVRELPLITDVQFEGVLETDRDEIAQELLKQNVELRKGSVLDPVVLKRASRVIQEFLEAKGWRDVKAESFVEQIKSTEVTVIFRVSANRPI